MSLELPSVNRSNEKNLEIRKWKTYNFNKKWKLNKFLVGGLKPQRLKVHQGIRLLDLHQAKTRVKCKLNKKDLKSNNRSWLKNLKIKPERHPLKSSRSSKSWNKSRLKLRDKQVKELNLTRQDSTLHKLVKMNLSNYRKNKL